MMWLQIGLGVVALAWICVGLPFYCGRFADAWEARLQARVAHYMRTGKW